MRSAKALSKFQPVLPGAPGEPPIVDENGSWDPLVIEEEVDPEAIPKALCGMPKRSKDAVGTCSFPAGKNTTHEGFGSCWLHMGATPTHRKHAARKAAQHFAVALDVSPEEALLMEVRRSSGRVQWVDVTVANYDPTALIDDGPDGVAVRRLEAYGLEQRKHLARTAKMAVDAGIAERQVALAEKTGEAIWFVLQRAAEQMQLTDAQLELMPAAFRDALLSLDGGDEQELDAESWEALHGEL